MKNLVVANLDRISINFKPQKTTPLGDVYKFIELVIMLTARQSQFLVFNVHLLELLKSKWNFKSIFEIPNFQISK